MMGQYAIGIDYGTLSARGLLLNSETGEEVATSICLYTHGVMETSLPNGIKLGIDWALQHPRDYLEALTYITKDLLKQSHILAEEIIGIGVDFTSSTILPTTEDGTPLCFLENYEKEPHAYVKLWKHHSAQYYADQLNKVAEERGEAWLDLYGGKVSSEWVVPKVMQIVEEAPHIYNAAAKIIEAGDWIVWKMCGKEARSACSAGYKALWHYKYGYPSKDFFKALSPKLENFVEEKLSIDIRPLGSCAGYLTKEMAEQTGLKEGIPVAVAIIDAHASVAACKIDGPGKMLAIMGTSTCHMLLSETEVGVKGTCGIVKDGILPGFFGYEAGQSCVGDHFEWFANNCVPMSYYNEAISQKKEIQYYLMEKAQDLKVGESGLLALDWWNGVRSVLMDFDLSGLIIGISLKTRPEHIYRALIEATAYGTRQIIEAFEAQGILVEELYAAGGIADKNPMLIQIYADVCNKPIRLSGSNQSGALGSAIFGVAANQVASKNKSVKELAMQLGKLKEGVYKPNLENVKIYDVLFKEYQTLSKYFGEGQNKVMKTLKKLKMNKLEDFFS